MGPPRDSKTGPNFAHEDALMQAHGGPVAGIDEAGRGPWAGPVVAAAVILDRDNVPAELDDSKKLTQTKREMLFAEISAGATVGIGIGIAEVVRIDRDNILQATMWAMAQACTALSVRPSAALVDGNRCPEDLPCPAQPLVKGDALSLSVAAASIVAKVTRDRIMAELARAHPVYGWDRNKGYGTAEHVAALSEHGPCAHHRHSFRPIRDLVARQQARKAG